LNFLFVLAVGLVAGTISGVVGTGSAGAAWNAIASTTMNVTVLEW